MVDARDMVEEHLDEIALTNDATEGSSTAAYPETRAADIISAPEPPSIKKRKKAARKAGAATTPPSPWPPATSSSNLLFGLAGATAAAALTATVIRLLRSRRRSNAALLEKGTELPALPADGRAQPLNGKTFVCSSLFDLEVSRSKYSDEAQRTSSTARAILVLLDAGARLRGRTVTEELNLGLLGDREDAANPAAPGCSVSGCSSGVAAAVAGGVADIGLGVDHLAGVRVQSSVCGVSGFRPTRGHMPSEGCSWVTSSTDTVGWMVRDPALHPVIADAFQLPGALGSFRKTELLQLVIASEVFEALGPAGGRLRRVALAAARRWAGPEQTATGLLVTYLQKNVPSAAHFVGYDGDSEDVLEGIRRAAVTLQYSELLQRHGHLLEETSSLTPTVLEQLERAQDVGEEEVQAAQQVAAETSRAMRAILMGAVLILPTLPGPQPSLGAKAEELKKWERGTLQLAALAALTGCPQATLPVPGDKGDAPLGLSLLALPKSDQRLAHVAAALAPLLEVAASVKAVATPPLSPNQATQNGKAVNGKQQQSEEAAERQEALKQAGNAAFKAGRFEEAIEQYSLALAANPSNSVLHSNRAQALIKVGRFKEAEADCGKALQAGPNAKALLRRGTARAALSDIQGAVQDFKHVLTLEPTNRQARLELQNLKQLYNEGLDDSGLGSMFGAIPPPGTARSDMSF